MSHNTSPGPTGNYLIHEQFRRSSKNTCKPQSRSVLCQHQLRADIFMIMCGCTLAGRVARGFLCWVRDTSDARQSSSSLVRYRVVRESARGAGACSLAARLSTTEPPPFCHSLPPFSAVNLRFSHASFVGKMCGVFFSRSHLHLARLVRVRPAQVLYH